MKKAKKQLLQIKTKSLAKEETEVALKTAGRKKSFNLIAAT